MADIEEITNECIISEEGKILNDYFFKFILNYADTIDATINKMEQIKENTKEDTWSDYDRRIETKLYL